MAARENFCNLTQKQAEDRFACITYGSIYYEMNFNLAKGDIYSGDVDIKFKTNDVELGANVFLEFVGKSFKITSLNGQVPELVEDSHNYLRKEGIITLPEKYLLRNAENHISLHIETPYYLDGKGLHSMKDIDGAQYLWSTCEPHWFSRVAPVFDQPDLKAYWSLKCTTSNDWIVVTNETIKNKKDDKENSTIEWTFNQTRLLPCYLYFISTGPYAMVECEESKLYKKIPMSIYCRKSLEQYANAQKSDVFEFVSDTIRRYEEFFEFDYLFSKADTIFCPEYSTGAMENPGAVTYHENYLFRKLKPSREEISARGCTITHELAHMWFGDTVTMKWWNDLWLNESFADFINRVIMSDQFGNLSFEITDAWIHHNGRKDWGYKEDQAISTHPIACVVTDVAMSEGIFDGISYAKGAATLRQLYEIVGRATFKEVTKRYFHKYAWNNATLQDFLNVFKQVLNEKFGFTEGKEDWESVGKHNDIDQFNKDWIETAGMNQLKLSWDPKDFTDKKGKVVVNQTYCMEEYQLLRYHKMCLGFVGDNGQILFHKEVIVKNQEETLIEFDVPTTENIAAIIPNYKDWTFAKIILDSVSLKWMFSNISKVEGELTRCVLWRSLFDMMRDCREISAPELAYLMMENYVQEKSITIRDKLMSYLLGTIATYTPESMTGDLKKAGFMLILDLIEKATDEATKKNLHTKIASFLTNDKDS